MSDHAPNTRAVEAELSGRTTPARLALRYSLLIFGAVLLLIPFLWLVTGSLKTDQEISNLSQWFPETPQWGNFIESLEYMGLRLPEWAANALGGTPHPDLWIPRFPALANTIVVTTIVLVLQVLSSAIIGYGFARFRFRGRSITFMVMLATMMLPYQVSMIPVFLLFRQLGWIDTLLPLIVPFAFGQPFFIFMFRQFFMQIPHDLHEAAKIDGASAWRTFWQVMLPLTKPVIAIVAIYSFMFTWNDFLAPLIYLNSPEQRTLAVELNSFNGQYGVEHRELLLAASLITMLPCVVIFFAAQRYFVDSGAASGLKT
ncbi:MAG: ABC transporter permease [Phycisphaeraceae bacterium]|nr:MAG: ABC transporter permease [Phycisphaeraceae bacterium]